MEAPHPLIIYADHFREAVRNKSSADGGLTAEQGKDQLSEVNRITTTTWRPAEFSTRLRSAPVL